MRIEEVRGLISTFACIISVGCIRMAEAYIKPEYALSEITSRIIAAATLVHRNLGPGFEEVIYQRTL